MSKGIDYGMGQSNIDKETGIRYGIIPLNDLDPWAAEDFDPDFGDPTCPECGNEMVEFDREGDHKDYERQAAAEYACESCKKAFNTEHSFPESPHRWTLDGEEYKSFFGEDNDVWVLKSPYYTRAKFCSPCAPGACYLRDSIEDGEKCYCFGTDWFENDTPPYPVWKVEDDSVVFTPQKET